MEAISGNKTAFGSVEDDIVRRGMICQDQYSIVPRALIECLNGPSGGDSGKGAVIILVMSRSLVNTSLQEVSFKPL